MLLAVCLNVSYIRETFLLIKMTFMKSVFLILISSNLFLPPFVGWQLVGVAK